MSSPIILTINPVVLIIAVVLLIALICVGCAKKPEHDKKDKRVEEIIDGLERLKFFNQRAGRELWHDKPKDVQDKDIANADATLQKTIEFCKEKNK